MVDQAAELRNLVLRREARNPQGSTSASGSAPVVRMETCAPGAPMWQPENPRTAWHPSDDAAGTPRLVVLLGGKGGVGVTTLALNLSIALVVRHHRVVLVDADLYRADVAILCGLRAHRDIGDVLAGDRDITDVLQAGPGGIQVVPGVWAPDHEVPNDCRVRQRLLKQLQELRTDTDVVMLDIGSTGAETARHLWPAVHDTVWVTTPDAVAIMDCYATMKTMLGNPNDTDRQGARSGAANAPTDALHGTSSAEYRAPGRRPIERGLTALGLITNQVENRRAARDVHRRIARSARRFLGHEIVDLGGVPLERGLRHTVAGGQPFILAEPDAPAAHAIHAIAERLARTWGRSEKTNQPAA